MSPPLAEAEAQPVSTAARRQMLHEVIFHLEAVNRQSWSFPPLARSENSASFEEMMSDATVSYAVGLLQEAVLAAEWHVEPAGKERGQLALADEIQRNLNDVDVDGAIHDALDALWRGFRVQEISWKYRERRFWLETLAAINHSQVALELTDQMEVSAILSKPPGHEVQRLPREKVWFHRNRASRENPAGISMLESAFRPWSSKNRLLQFWGLSIQRFGMTHMKVTIPANTPPAEQTAILNTLYQGRLDGIYLIKDSYVVEEMNPSQWANMTFEAALQYQDAQIVQAVLFVHTPSSTSANQTYISGAGLGEQARATAFRLQRISRALARSFTEDVIEPLCLANWGAARGQAPKLVIGKPDAGRIAALSQALSDLVLSGITDPTTAADQLGLPEPAEGGVGLAWTGKLGVGRPTPV